MADLIREAQPADPDEVARAASGDGAGVREMLPSARELELGIAEQAEVRPAPAGIQPIERETTRRRVRGAFTQYIRDADPRTIQGPKLPLIVLGVTGFVGSWVANLQGVFFPELQRDFGVDVQGLFTMTAVMATAFAFINPLLGYIADRAPRIWMLRGGAIAQSAAIVGVASAQSIPSLMGSYAVSGVGKNLAGPAGTPLAADYFPVHARARVFAFVAAIATVGTILSFGAGGVLIEHFGWRSAFLGLGVLGVLVSLTTFLLREPTRGYFDRKAAGATEEVARHEQKPMTWSEGWRAAASIKSLRRLWYAAPILHVGQLTIGVVLNLYYFEEFGVGPAGRANIEMAGAIFGLAGLITGGALADRFLAYKPGRVPQVLAAMIGMNAISVLVLVLSNNLWLSIAFRLPMAFVNSLVAPAYLTLISMVIPARMRGFGLQTFAWWQLLALVIEPTIGGFIDANPLRVGLASFAPVLLVASAIMWTVGYGVEHDIRNALAASMADEDAAKARAAGKGKMVIARDVDVHYGDVQVLFHVDFDVYEHEIIALLGTNGAGKSTLLRALSGLTEPSAGAIFIDGRDTTHLPAHQLAALGVAQMPGGRAVFPGLTVAENLRAAAWLTERTEPEQVENEIEHLTTVLFPTLRTRMDQAAGTLSGGEQQMVGISQAFIMRPRLLMIDELSLGLAPSVVQQLLDALRALRDQGTTVILVEQSVNLALTVADRAVFMEKGEVRFTGPAAELLTRGDLVRSVLLRGRGAGQTHRMVHARRDRAGTEGATAALQVRDVAVSFGGVAALRGVSIEVAPSEIVGIIGPNGAGKTTLFDVISGFVPPESGSVLLAARDVTATTPDERARLGLGRSFQDSRLFPGMTVRENIMVALERHLNARNAIRAAVWTPATRRSEVRARRRADNLIELLGLGEHRDKLVGELSTGLRRLTDLALQLAADPDVLMLDEPSSGVAQAETLELGVLLQRVRREANCALVVIEHDIELIAGMSDRLIAMDLGVVLTEGEPGAVLADDRVAAAYLGGATLPAQKGPR